MRKVSNQSPKKKPDRNIYIDGIFIDVWLVDGQWKDSEGKIYEYLPSGKYAKVEFKKDHFPKSCIPNLEPYQETTLEDGTTWRNQPNSKGKFEVMCVSGPKKFTSLSPQIRQGFSSIKGSK